MLAVAITLLRTLPQLQRGPAQSLHWHLQAAPGEAFYQIQSRHRRWQRLLRGLLQWPKEQPLPSPQLVEQKTSLPSVHPKTQTVRKVQEFLADVLALRTLDKIIFSHTSYRTEGPKAHCKESRGRCGGYYNNTATNHQSDPSSLDQGWILCSYLLGAFLNCT